MTFYTNGGGEKMRIGSDGAIKFNTYNFANQTGTPTYLLGTDASGNVVKSLSTPGGDPGPYLPLSGGTMTGTNGVLMPDNFKLKVGTGSDLQIYNDGVSTNIIDSFNMSQMLFRQHFLNGDMTFQSDDGTGGVTTYFRLDGSSGDVVFTNPGNVGIGTTAPDSPLEVQFTEATGTAKQMLHIDYNSDNNYGSGYLKISAGGSSQALTFIEQVTSGGNGLFGTYIDTNIINKGLSASTHGNINFVTGSSTSASSIVMTIGGGSQKGNVGIGEIAPAAKLHLKGSFNSQFFTQSTGGTTNKFGISSGTAFASFTVGSSITTAARFYHDNSYITFAENGANVGIGTTGPAAKLHVLSTSTTEPTARIQSNGYTFLAGGANDPYHALILRGIPAAATTYAVTAGDQMSFLEYGGDFRFYEKNSLNSGTLNEISRIHKTDSFFLSNVGIGTTSPDGKLEIVQTSGDGTPTLIVANDISGVSGYTFQSWRYVDGNTNFRLDLKQKTLSGVVKYAFDMVNNGTGFNDVLVLDRGKVGIGTSSPETPLHVLTNTTDNASTMLIQNGSTGDASIKFNISGDTYSIGIDNSDSDKFKLSYGAVGTNDRIVVDTSGNVGIGTTSPAEKLSLPDNAKIGLGSSADLQMYHNATNSVISNSTGHLYIKTTVADKDIIFEASNGAGSVESYLEIDSDQQDIKVNKRIEMTGTGSAGGQHTIEFNPGTSAIGYIYHDDTNFNVRAIKASSDLVLEATHGNVQILNGNGSGTEVGVMIEQYIAHIGDTDTKFGFTAANQFQVIAGGNTNLNVQGNGVDLSYAGSTRLTTQTGGIAITGDLTVTADVGIGLTNPDVPLHVTANEDGSGIDKGSAKFINTNTGQGATTMHMVQTSSSNFANAVKFWQGSTPTAVGFIRLTTSATQFITSASDLNLKKNITNWSDDTLSKFKALEPKKFRFKTQDVSEDKTLGFIAQNEVDNFPEAYPQFLGDDEKPYYGFNPTGMVPHLMKAIKDLVEKVEILENKITQLENNN